MQESAFAVAVQGLKATDPRDLVSQLNKVFLHITKLNADEAVAAYQALSLIEETLDGDVGTNVAVHLKKAVVQQMQRLKKDAVVGSSLTYNINLLRRFRAVTGEEFS